MQTCGYCGGTGRVLNPQRDAYGPRPDYPAEAACNYCSGSGQVEDGDKLIRQERDKVYQADDEDRRRAGLPAWA